MKAGRWDHLRTPRTCSQARLLFFPFAHSCPLKCSAFMSWHSAPYRQSILLKNHQIFWLLTADVQVNGVASLSVRVLKAAVESVVAQVHLGQDEPGTLQTVLGLHVRPVHLPRNRRLIVQGATLHGDITAHPLVLVPSNWRQNHKFGFASVWIETTWRRSCSSCHDGATITEHMELIIWLERLLIILQKSR